MNQSHRTHGNSGGQVVNVIIILFVIAVVAAVLFPVLANIGHHQYPRKSYCQSNMKECAIALQTYWNDYDAHLPSSAVVSHSKKWNRSDFCAFATERGSVEPLPKQPKTWYTLLYNCMKNKDICFCPSDSADHSNARSHVSYFWKAAIDKAWYGVGCAKPCRRESDFAYSAHQVVLYERSAFHEGKYNGLNDGVKINVAFLDTHVKNHTLVNSGELLIDDPLAPGEPRYFNYDNKAPRGKEELPPGIRATYIDPNRYSDKLP